MGTSNYNDDFKQGAVHPFAVRSYPVREVSRRVGVRWRGYRPPRVWATLTFDKLKSDFRPR